MNRGDFEIDDFERASRELQQGSPLRICDGTFSEEEDLRIFRLFRASGVRAYQLDRESKTYYFAGNCAQLVRLCRMLFSDGDRSARARAAMDQCLSPAGTLPHQVSLGNLQEKGLTQAYEAHELAWKAFRHLAPLRISNIWTRAFDDRYCQELQRILVQAELHEGRDYLRKDNQCFLVNGSPAQLIEVCTSILQKYRLEYKSMALRDWTTPILEYLLLPQTLQIPQNL